MLTTAMCALALTLPTPQPDDTEAAVIDWVKQHAVPLQTVEAGHGFDDLAPIRDMVGDARIVSLGESTHGTREIFQMKHRMLEYLVEEMGFTIFGIEASFPDCVAINDYVMHGRGDPEVALHGQGFWTWDTEEVLDLIKWMRAYNENPAHETQLKFYGYDMQVTTPALDVAIPYLRQFDEGRADALAERLAPLRDPMLFRNHSTWQEEDRAAITSAVEDLLATFDEGQAAMTNVTGVADWSMARQHAVIVSQFEEMLRVNARMMLFNTPEAQRIAMNLSSNCAALLQYLDKVDFDYAETVRELLAGYSLLGPDMHLLAYRDSMDEEERGEQHHAVDALLERIESSKDAYVSRLSDSEWNEARLRAADLVKFVDLCKAFANMPEQMTNVRDRSMAENIAWILEREGAEARIVVWAHNGHVSHNPAPYGTSSMGTDLEHLFGDDHMNFGFSFNRGSFQAIYRAPEGQPWDGGPSLRPHTVGDAIRGSIDSLFSKTELPMFILDVRNRPAAGPVTQWLEQPHLMRSIGALFTTEQGQSWYAPTVLPDHYDCLIFINQTTRARPNRLTREKFGMPDEEYEPQVNSDAEGATNPGPETRG